MNTRPRPHWLRQSKQFWIGFACYLAAQLAAAKAIVSFDLSHSTKLAVGLLPLVPMLVLALGLLKMIKKEDELYRRIQFEAIAFAAAVVIMTSFTLGLLETFAVIPHVNSMWAGMVLIVVWGLTQGVLTRRYG